MVSRSLMSFRPFGAPKGPKTHPPERSGAAATSCFAKRYLSSMPLTAGDGFFLVLCILLRAYALSARSAKSGGGLFFFIITVLKAATYKAGAFFKLPAIRLG